MEFNYFDGRPHDVHAEHRRRINIQIHDRFRIRDTYDPLNMSITEFTKIYRMPQDAVVTLLNVLRPYVPQRRSPNQTPLLTKILVALSFYASGSYQRFVGRSVDCSVSQTSVSRHVKEITDTLNHPEILTRYIRFPLTAEERAPFIARNERLGMPRVLGFIDGTLVRLSYLPHDNERQAYFSRKGFLALNCQVICDSGLYIMNVDARFPGSCNDHYIWSASAARDVVEQAYWEDRCWLLGDTGYFTAPWMHIPLPHAPPGTPEFYYTRLHCRCRNVVERCIGVLKGRWRCLSVDRCINYKSATYAGNIFNACSVLHNFCLENGVANPQPVFENDINLDDPAQDEEDLPLDVHLRGIAERNYLINYVNERRQRQNQ